LPHPAQSNSLRQGEHAQGDRERDQHRQAVACGRRSADADIGSTYPDVELGLWVHPTVLGPNTLALVPGSISAFQGVINPGLQKTYGTVGAAFVDVTQATGAYGPFLATNDPTFGQIPVPVAKVCTLTFFCDGSFNIHMKTPGYHIISALEAKTLPKL
jgi:hypothetical protein